MALNVKAIFYLTVGYVLPYLTTLSLTQNKISLLPLLRKGTSALAPARIINVASVAGITTRNPTTTEAGGLSAVGSGTYSCKSCSCSIIYTNTDVIQTDLLKQHVSICQDNKHLNLPLKTSW